MQGTPFLSVSKWVLFHKTGFADCEEKGTNTVNAIYKNIYSNQIIINEEISGLVSKGVQKRQGAHQRFSQETLRSETPNETKKRKHNPHKI